MTKRKEEEWNDGTLEYWVNKKSWIHLHYSIISLFQYSRIILLNFGICYSFGIWIL
jgi:hypothetical protein